MTTGEITERIVEVSEAVILGTMSLDKAEEEIEGLATLSKSMNVEIDSKEIMYILQKDYNARSKQILDSWLSIKDVYAR